MMEMQTDVSWHLDKRVPVALLAAILIQTGGALWWAASISARVEQLERAAVSQAPQAERLIRLETKVDAMHDDVGEIKALVRSQTPVVKMPAR